MQKLAGKEGLTELLSVVFNGIQVAQTFPFLEVQRNFIKSS